MNQGKDKRPEDLRESDFAEERMGNNRLQGNDQESVHNQRHAVPEVKQEADDVMESFEKLDKDKRARDDLNKGVRKDGGNA
ncbi:hypothetical protein ACLB6G_08850 [Zhengella sp. ZM62]|uniref:hypothetical protein n=1 Tax=Zhengella sedimenti TaxID=3390035 RepID=UPI003976BFFD